MSDISNYSDDTNIRPSSRVAEPDAYGQAALLLVESTLHALIEAGALTLPQALSAVTTACEVKVEVADEIGESSGRMQQSIELLAGIRASLVTGDADQVEADVGA